MRYKTYSPFVDGVMAFYSSGHSVRETAETFKVTIHQVNNWAKVRRVSNGIKSDYKAMAKVRAEQMGRETEQRIIARLDSFGFDYLGGYENVNSILRIKCRACGEITERKANAIRHESDRPTCFNCQHKKTLERQAQRQAEQERQRAEREAKRLAKNPLGLSSYQLERSKVLDDPHVCKVCGKTYTMREYMKDSGIKYKRVSGFCSIKCKKLDKRHKEQNRRKISGESNGRHYSRARKLGLPRERGITLKKLIERDGLQCHICGLMCIYDGDGKGDLYPSIDHLLPIARGGGHTWDNVKVAHRRCNSVKADRVLASDGTYVRTGQKGRAETP